MTVLHAAHLMLPWSFLPPNIEVDLADEAAAAGAVLFVPFDFALWYTPAERTVFALIETKHRVEEALRAAEVPYTIVLTGVFVEDCIATLFIEIDVKNDMTLIVIIAALTKKHGVVPQVTVPLLKETDDEIVASESTLQPLLRITWGTGSFPTGSRDVWRVPEYGRPTIKELILAV
ncbi:hypothetical protein GGF32_007645 [Allomyces javanicus]|nr:hypothetical protein GGF32_007645 [Allomyces javanicus]